MDINWSRIVESAIGPLLGTILGGLIAVIGIYLKEVFDRRRAIQSWYEQRYIFDGVDLVMAYVMSTQYRLMEQAFDLAFLQDVKLEPLPLDALNRLVTILHTPELTSLIGLLNSALDKPMHPRIKEGLAQFTVLTQTCVFTLQQILIRVRVKRKSDIYKISERKDTKAVLAFIKQAAGEGHKLIRDLGDKLKEAAASQSQ